METKASLNAQLAAAQKKHGAKSQAAGRIQYKLNQLNKDSKGTVVRTKDGKAVKSKTGVIRQKDASKKVRKPAVKKLTMDRNPNTVTKAATKVATKVAPKKVTNKVTVTPYKAAKITSMPYTTAERQAEFNRFNEQHRKNLAAIKAAKKEAKRQNDSIDKMARKADKEMRANKKKTDRVKKQTAQEKAQAAYRKSAASVISSRKTGNYSGL
tara:strand:- start:41 stop:673 length:633 start_codon:yes stop_codon:yes gene_type:complete